MKGYRVVKLEVMNGHGWVPLPPLAEVQAGRWSVALQRVGQHVALHTKGRKLRSIQVVLERG